VMAARSRPAATSVKVAVGKGGAGDSGGPDARERPPEGTYK
jgi:hypothetical protein